MLHAGERFDDPHATAWAGVVEPAEARTARRRLAVSLRAAAARRRGRRAPGPDAAPAG